MADFWNQLGGLVGAGINMAGIESARNDLISAGQQANVGAQQIGQTAFEQSQFKPFSVTSGTGSISTSPTGGTTTTLAPQQQQLQQSLFGQQNAMAGYLGGFNPNQFSNLANMGYGGAQGFAGQAQQLDPYMQQQRSQMQGLFGQQLGQVGQPTGFEGLTSQALQQGQQRIGQAMQPADINMLRGMFANQVQGQLGQQPSSQFQNLAQYGSQAGLQGLQQVSDVGQQFGNLSGAFGQQAQNILGQPTASQQLGQIGQQAYGGAGAQLGQGAPADIEALRAQYGGLAGQAGQQLGAFDRAGRETDIYGRLRAMQTPEEERQRLELEQRLFAQGRGGVQTAQYGGTPEQLAMAKAQAEAQNQAGLMAMQQAGTEEQAALNRALSLSGQAGQFAGMSSDLQSASQQRGAQLAQLGMSSEQIQSQLASEGLSRASGAAGVSGQLATTGDQLRSSAQNRAMQLSQMGMSAEQIQSQLQSEGLSRAGTSAGLASSLAGQASNLESAGLDRGLGLAQLGMAGSQQQQAQEMQRLQQLMALQQGDIGAAGAQQALQQGNLGLAGGMFGLGQQATQSPYQTQALGLQNLLAQLQAGYAPENQLLNQLQASTNIASIADYGRRFGADQQAEAGMSGLEAMLTGQRAGSELEQEYYKTAAGLFGQQAGGQQGLLGQIFGGAGAAAVNQQGQSTSGFNTGLLQDLLKGYI
jgi:hypothetical protein